MTVGGIVSESKKIRTKSGSNMMFATLDDLFVGVPVKLGASGIEDIIELALRDEELGDLNDSADAEEFILKVALSLNVAMHQARVMRCLQPTAHLA